MHLILIWIFMKNPYIYNIKPNMISDLSDKKINMRSQLSADLRTEFPDIQGFSTTNLKYMKM